MVKGKQAPTIRRTSSLAYDDALEETQNHRGLDSWRKRWNLPPRSPLVTSTSTSTALASSPSTSSLSEQQDGTMKPIYTFGVLTDIQYAPIPDGTSYSGNPRYYRHARKAAEHAALHFQEEQAHCIVNLGDIVDGKCSDVEKWGGSLSDNDAGEEKNSEGEKKTNGSGSGSGVGHDAIDDVLKALSSYNTGRILHTYGNHELYNLNRSELAQKLSIPFRLEPTDDLVGYYDHLLHETEQSSDMKLRFLFIDSYDICLLDRCPENSPKRKRAHEILIKNNPNYPKDSNSPAGLEGLSKRFVAFNGAVDVPQMEWLEESLQMARENGEKVILCSHQPIHPQSTWPTCLIWNYDEVLTIVRKYGDVVCASFSGHAHKGGYIRDEESGVHFRVFEAVLESPDPIKTYAMVDVWEDRMVLRGCGDCMSDMYDFDHLTIAAENNVYNDA